MGARVSYGSMLLKAVGHRTIGLARLIRASRRWHAMYVHMLPAFVVRDFRLSFLSKRRLHNARCLENRRMNEALVPLAVLPVNMITFKLWT